MFIPITVLLDIGNILFFLAAFPQIVSAYRNRKNLAGLSLGLLLGYASGTVCFAIGNYYVGAYIASTLCVISLAFYAIQLYWKWKYRPKRSIWREWIRKNTPRLDV